LAASARHKGPLKRPRGNKVSLDLTDDLGTFGFIERRRRSRRWTLGSLAAAVLAPPVRAFAAPPLGEPRGEVILTVTGGIDVTNGDGVARLDRELLLGMGTAELTTSTPFTEGVSTFMGVLASRLLDRLGATGSELRTKALNDYAVTIPVAEIREYSVLLALDRDEQPLSVRERGPLWVIYPWQEYPELDDRVHRQRAIWQLTRIDVV
jgi:hypothetical protein